MTSSITTRALRAAGRRHPGWTFFASDEGRVYASTLNRLDRLAAPNGWTEHGATLAAAEAAADAHDARMSRLAA